MKNIPQKTALFITFFLCVFSCGYISAQTDGYVLERVRRSYQFHQIISWETYGGYVYRYELTIAQRQSDGTYNEVLVESVKETSFTTTLIPGEYRYRVKAFNLLNQVERESAWVTLTVLRAYKPTITAISTRRIDIDKEPVVKFTLFGTYLDESTEIYLSMIRSEDRSQKKGDLPKRILPSRVVPDVKNGQVEIEFTQNSLKAGVYEIAAVNQGGLRDNFSSLALIHTSSMHWEITGTLPFINSALPVDSPFYVQYWNDGPIAKSAKIRFSFFPKEISVGRLGAEVLPFWALSDEKSELYELSMHIVGANFNVVYQYPFLDEKLVLNARLGAGIGSYLDMHYNVNGVTSKSLNTAFPSMDVGISLQYYPLRKPHFSKLFVDVGLEYVRLFDKDMPLSFIMPGISIGYRF